MKVFKKFVWLELTKVSGLLLLIFTVFYWLGEFFDKLGSFLGYKKPLILFLVYIFWKTWSNLYEFFPWVLGFCPVLVLLWWAKTNELIAFLSLGISKEELIKELGKALFFMSFLGTLGLNLIFPYATFQAFYTWDYKISEKKEIYLIFKDILYLPGKDFFLVAKPLDFQGEFLEDVIIVFLEKEIPFEVIWAKRAFYRDGNWHLQELIIQKKENHFFPEKFSYWEGSLPFTPEKLVITEKSIKFMSLRELYEKIKVLREVKRPYNEIIGEMFWRLVYFLIPLTLSNWSMWFFFKNFFPSQISLPFLKSLVLYFLSLFILLFFQTLVKKGWILVIVLFFLFLLISNLIFYVVLRKSN